MNQKFQEPTHIIEAERHWMEDSFFHQPFPVASLEQVDPFILLHHWGPNDYSDGKKPLSFGAHPHRGFVPVTFIFEGEVFHRDSLGHESVIKTGGVQWMRSGSGIVHAEGPTPEFQKQGGTVEMIQVWINLPQKLKMSDPDYQGFQKDEIPLISMQDGKVQMQVVSGTWFDVEGPVDSLTDIQSATITLSAGTRQKIPIRSGHNVVCYLLSGEALINNSQVSAHHAITFEPAEGPLLIDVREETRILLLTGEPLDEPVVQHGPFVMNTRDEVMEAMKDYQAGKMGVLKNA